MPMLIPVRLPRRLTSRSGMRICWDRKYPEAVSALHSANLAGQSLDDYADYLTAQVYLQNNKLPDAESVLE